MNYLFLKKKLLNSSYWFFNDNSLNHIFQNNLYKQTVDNLDNDFNSSYSILYHHKKQINNSINNQYNYDSIPNEIHTNNNISIKHFKSRSLIKY